MKDFLSEIEKTKFVQTKKRKRISDNKNEYQ